MSDETRLTKIERILEGREEHHPAGPVDNEWLRRHPDGHAPTPDPTTADLIRQAREDLRGEYPWPSGLLRALAARLEAQQAVVDAVRREKERTHDINQYQRAVCMRGRAGGISCEVCAALARVEGGE